MVPGPPASPGEARLLRPGGVSSGCEQQVRRDLILFRLPPMCRVTEGKKPRLSGPLGNLVQQMVEARSPPAGPFLDPVSAATLGSSPRQGYLPQRTRGSVWVLKPSRTP